MTQRGHAHVHDAIHAGSDGRWHTATVALCHLSQIVRNVPAFVRAWQRRCDEQAFLAGLISWNQIADVSVAVLDAHDGASPDTVDEVIAADAEARRRATAFIDTLART